MNCVILQPSYIPWRGYFDQIQQADLFIFYDDVQYDKHGWRNRNRIKTAQGPLWLSIPVSNKGTISNHMLINEMNICWTTDWPRNHWKSIETAYGKAPYFNLYAEGLHELYFSHPDLLVDFTIPLTIHIARALGIQSTRFIRSSEIEGITGTKTDRLIEILTKVGADQYFSGPSARDYIEPEKFSAAGIHLDYFEYNYPEYEQLYPPYDPFVSVLDLMFMQGEQALGFITGEISS
jgi:hypothetical protein